MNVPQEALNLASQVDYRDPRRTYDDLEQPYDLTGQQPSWKDASDVQTTQTNGGHVKTVTSKEERGDVGYREEEAEEEDEEEGNGRRGDVSGSDDEEFSDSFSHGSEDEQADVEDEEDDQSEGQISDHKNTEGRSTEFTSRDTQQSGPYPEHQNHRATSHDRNANTDNEGSKHLLHESYPRTDNTRHGGFDQREKVEEEEEEEEEEENEDEEEDERREDDDDEDDDEEEDDEEDRIKETQELVAKIEHDIEGLRFQAKQRGHLLSDLHRYGSKNQQQKVEHEQTQQPSPRQNPDLAQELEEPPQRSDEAKIIERPVSIKLRLRTRSTSPKAQQTRFSVPPIVPTKAGRVKMRPLRIGNQLGRWEAWKERLAVKSDRDMAKVLMDHMDKTYFQQFLPQPSPRSAKGHKRKKKDSKEKEGRKSKKPKKIKREKEEGPVEWDEVFLDDDLEDLYDDPLVEEKDDYDYDPSFEVPYANRSPVRNKRKSQRPRKLMDVSSKQPKPKAPKTTSQATEVKQRSEVNQGSEVNPVALTLRGLPRKKRGRKPKPKVEKIKKKGPRIHRGGRRPTLMSKLRRLDWNAMPRRYECKICCQRLDGITAFRSHLETSHSSEYLKNKDGQGNKAGEEENADGAQSGDRQYHELSGMQDHHMLDPEQRRVSENEMYRSLSNAYGQDVADARRYEMMPPFKRHLHESYSNDWGKVQGNVYSRPPAPGQMSGGEQGWGHGRGYDAVPGYRKHYEDGREWGKGGAPYMNVPASMGQNMHMGMDGDGVGHRPNQSDGYNMQHGVGMMGLEQGSSQDDGYGDISMRQGGGNPQQQRGGMDQGADRVAQQGDKPPAEPDPPAPPPPEDDDEEGEEDEEALAIAEMAEVEEEANDDEDGKQVEGEAEPSKKRKKTKPYKEWEDIDRWAVTLVHCPQCEDFIRFRPGQKNFHFAVHAERRLCQECGKMFTKEAFRAHVRVHQQKRQGVLLKHICEICGKGYRFKCSLSSHMRCHTGERDFDCKICGKKFLSQHGLEKHELVHRKVKPHLCPDCGRGFTQYHNMLAHRRQHTGEKPYKCDCCDRSFTHNVSLKNHKKKEHGIDLWAGSEMPEPSNEQRKAPSRGSSTVTTPPPIPPPKTHAGNERELNMHTLDTAQIYSMLPTLGEYSHY